jgi:hypothetical protein
MVSCAMAIKWLSLIFLLITLSSTQAQTINAASCNASAVQTAFNSVTSSTTAVNIPAGTCTWTSQVTLNVPSGSTTLSILGAGNQSTPGGGDATVIVDGDTTDSNSLLVVTTGKASSSFRFAGFTVEGGSGGIKNNGVVSINGFSQNMRFDHNHLNMQTYSPSNNGNALRFNNWIYGVVDHNIIDLESVGNGLSIWYDEYNNDSAGFGDDAWAANTSLGSNQFLFVETNTFNSGSNNSHGTASDCSHGGKYVWRFNTMNGAALQTHPTGGSGRGRGCRAWEIYNNTFSGNNSGGGANANFNLFFMSSGTGVIWGNSATTGYTNFVTIHSMQVDNSTYSESAPPAEWGYCGTSFASSSAWDGPAPSGYPCIDQPGRGKGDLLQGQFPNTCDVTSGQCAKSNYNGSFSNEALEPVYEWMNNYVPVPGAGGNYWANYEASVLAQNRDFYLWCNSSSASGCTSSFNGTVGTGSGVLAARPSSCTTGVAYWATDQGSWNQSGSGGQGQLFVCTATNTWSAYYTPYPYPHPLISSSSAPVPAPPVNLLAVPH